MPQQIMEAPPRVVNIVSQPIPQPMSVPHQTVRVVEVPPAIVSKPMPPVDWNPGMPPEHHSRQAVPGVVNPMMNRVVVTKRPEVPPFVQGNPEPVRMPHYVDMPPHNVVHVRREEPPQYREYHPGIDNRFDERQHNPHSH